MTDSFDFSQLKSFKTPENWIETAIKIPQKKKPLPFILRPYVIGTAASLVIVAAAVLTILLSSGGKPPLGNEHGFAVQPAVTVPTEIIEETNASGEVIATHVVPVITEGTTPQATEIIEVTNNSGEVIATQAVPVTSPPATGATTAPNTNPAQTTGGTTATEATIKPTTAEPTAPATVPVTIHTQPAWDVQETTNISEEVDPAIEDVTDNIQTGKTDPPTEYTGTLTLIITPDSPLFGSVYVKLDIYNESGDKVGNTVVLKPKLSNAGFKAVTITPGDQGMTLYRWQTYTLRVYDTNGNSSTASVTPSFAGSFAVNV